MSAGAPDIAVTTAVVDYTDDPGGFAGLIPGSSPWPLAAANGASGTGHTLNNDFAARISTNLTISTAGTYGFQTYADDGVRLQVDGTNVIVDDTYHPEEQRFGSLFLASGTHFIDLIFFEGGGEASLEFSMNFEDGEFGHVGDFEGTSTSVETVPEPSTVALLGLGVAALGFRHRRNRKARQA
jgi:hypothetical protein